MLAVTKKVRVALILTGALYIVFHLVWRTNADGPYYAKFAMKYKHSRPAGEVSLKTHGQALAKDGQSRSGNSAGAKGASSQTSLSSQSSLSSLEFSVTPSSPQNSLSEHASLREQLAFHFPYHPHKPIPRFIWQTWKVDLESSKFPSNLKHLVRRWAALNPGFVHKLLPDSACHELVRQLYQTVPDVLRAYELLPHPILKADFFRYLVVFARGGVYSDIDTFNLKEVAAWPSYAERVYGKPNNVGLVVGIEADPDRPDWAQWYARRIQFCQWTIQGKQGHPLLGALITRITEITLERLEKGTLKLAKGSEEGADIMNWTGPGIFTDEIFNYLNNVATHHDKAAPNDIYTGVPPKVTAPLTSNSNSNDDNSSTASATSDEEEEEENRRAAKVLTSKNGFIVNPNLRLSEPANGLSDPKLDAVENAKIINWKLFTGMEKPILIDDVLVLPITSFSPGVGQMGAKDEEDELAYVKHMFEGSWKNEQKQQSRSAQYNVE